MRVLVALSALVAFAAGQDYEELPPVSQYFDTLQRRELYDGQDIVSSPPPAPVDCVWNAWTPWSECSQDCNTGTRVRYREKATYEYTGGDCAATVNDCSADSLIRAAGGVCTSRDVEACNRESSTMEPVGPFPPCDANTADSCVGFRPCPVDCVWSGWSSWSDCSAACGQNGVQYRTRTVVTEPTPSKYFLDDGSLPPYTDYDCETDVIFGDAAYYGDPSTRLQQYPCGVPCTGNHTEYRQCFRKECPVDCEWSVWSSWSSCSKLCGGGSQMRSRYVKVQPQHGGLLCEPTVCTQGTGGGKGRCGATETRTCNIMSCEYQRIRPNMDDASVYEDLCQFKDTDSIYCPINETRTGGPLTAVGADPRPNDAIKVNCIDEDDCTTSIA